ncbi:30S ribosomal protein S20 [Candidatus Omnitrophota bacterium]
MPQRRSGIKELRKNRKNQMHNLDIKTDLKKTIKSFVKTVDEKKAPEAKDQLKTVYKKLDKAAKRNILHKNTVARRKSKFSKLAANIA